MVGTGHYAVEDLETAVVLVRDREPMLDAEHNNAPR
jgi:hypothetical protein